MKKAAFYIVSALTLMFLGLKLADKIDWSWWWVFSPIWIPIAIWFALYLWSTFYCIRQYKKDPNFRKVVDFHNEQKRRENMGLAGRLQEMQRQAEEMQKLQRKH